MLLIVHPDKVSSSVKGAMIGRREQHVFSLSFWHEQKKNEWLINAIITRYGRSTISSVASL